MGAKLAFWDESGISQRATVKRTWSPKGKTPIILSTGNWRARSVAGIITCASKARKPKLFLRIFKHSIKHPDIIRCLKEWRRHVKGYVILLWDGLPAHKAKLTKQFIKEQKHWLKVYRFPAYAPELNPIEYLWSASKSKDLAGLYAGTIDNIDTHIRKSKRRFQRHPNLLTSFLKKSALFKKELST